MFKKIVKKICELRNLRIHENLKILAEKRKIIRKLDQDLSRFDNEMTPIYIEGRVFNAPQLMEAKRNGAYQLYQIAKDYQSLLRGIKKMSKREIFLTIIAVGSILTAVCFAEKWLEVRHPIIINLKSATTSISQERGNIWNQN